MLCASIVGNVSIVELSCSSVVSELMILLLSEFSAMDNAIGFDDYLPWWSLELMAEMLGVFALLLTHCHHLLEFFANFHKYQTHLCPPIS